MSCLSPANCKDIRDALRKYPWRHEARDFWAEHGDTLSELPINELRAFANAARRGKREPAYQVLVRNAPLQTWVAERHRTTTLLVELAKRRQAAAEAFRRIGWWALRVLGRVLGAVL